MRDYIARFETDAAALVAEEHYIQHLDQGAGVERTTVTRELRSDYVLVKPADREPWLGYRDIFEVDGAPVRDRDARLVQMLSSTAADSRERASAFVREGSRFNLGPERTVNTPTLPLQLLARANESRFRIGVPRGWARLEQVAVTFEERGRPTIVRTPEGAYVESRGTVVLRVSDGAILTAHLSFFFTGDRRKEPEARLSIEYGAVPNVTVPVPLRMIEELPMQGANATGTATYTNYRRFQTSARIR